MEREPILCRSAEVNGKRKIVAWVKSKTIKHSKSRARNFSLLGSRFIFIKVLSDDFADVDFCEELCYHSRPKKQNSKGEKRTKDECRKAMRGGKSGSRSQAVQRGRLRHRRAFRSGFPIFFGGVGLSAAARSAAVLVIDMLTPNCQLYEYLYVVKPKQKYLT